LNNCEGIVNCLLLVIVAVYCIVRRLYHCKEVVSSVRRTTEEMVLKNFIFSQLWPNHIFWQDF